MTKKQKLPKITFNESKKDINIDSVLDRLEEHQLLDSKYKEKVKEELIMNPNCNLILEHLCELDSLRLEMGYQASMFRKGIGRSLEYLDSPIKYYER